MFDLGDSPVCINQFCCRGCDGGGVLSGLPGDDYVLRAARGLGHIPLWGVSRFGGLAYGMQGDRRMFRVNGLISRQCPTKWLLEDATGNH